MTKSTKVQSFSNSIDENGEMPFQIAVKPWVWAANWRLVFEDAQSGIQKTPDAPPRDCNPFALSWKSEMSIEAESS